MADVLCDVNDGKSIKIITSFLISTRVLLLSSHFITIYFSCHLDNFSSLYEQKIGAHDNRTHTAHSR